MPPTHRLRRRPAILTLPHLDSELHKLLEAIHPQLLLAALADNRHPALREGEAVQVERAEMDTVATLTLTLRKRSQQQVGKRTTRVIHSVLVHSFNVPHPLSDKADSSSETVVRGPMAVAPTQTARRSSASRGRRGTANS